MTPNTNGSHEPDYHQRFREQFQCNATNESDILAFIDEIAREQSAASFKDGKAFAAQSLIGRVEGASDNCKYGHSFTAQCERCVARAEMANDLLTHLRGEETFTLKEAGNRAREVGHRIEKEWKEYAKEEPPPQEETECCKECANYVDKDACKNGYCPCHKPRTELPKETNQ